MAWREQHSPPHEWDQQLSVSESPNWRQQESGDESGICMDAALCDAGSKPRKRKMMLPSVMLDVQGGPHKLRDEELCKYAKNGLDKHRIQRLLTAGHVNVMVVFCLQ